MHRVFRALALLSVLGCRKAPPAVTGPLVDDAGVQFALATPPSRIVSLVPATTELVFALGAGARLVGRTAWCDYPAEAAAVPNLGNGIDPNVEVVVAARPDLVLLYKSGANRAAAERLRALGIPTLELATDRMEDFDRITRLLGAALGVAAQADSVVERTRRDLAAASRSPLEHRPSVFILAWDRPAMTLGRGSFLSEILDHAGARNVFDDLATSSAPVSVEAVAARNPDYILVSSQGEPAITGRPEWRVVRAVRDRKFLRVSGSEFNRPSPRIGSAVRRLAAALDSLAR
ncbi:MAG TPA: helical backbone metal receptor [Gemmatimonadales bacterium]|nr:helical backbone metal receptor [Gemmatimonadales bacterium]